MSHESPARGRGWCDKCHTPNHGTITLFPHPPPFALYSLHSILLSLHHLHLLICCSLPPPPHTMWYHLRWQTITRALSLSFSLSLQHTPLSSWFFSLVGILARVWGQWVASEPYSLNSTPVSPPTPQVSPPMEASARGQIHRQNAISGRAGLLAQKK